MLEAIGSICLGIVICYIVLFVIYHISKFTIRDLLVISTFLFGEVLLELWKKHENSTWYYFIGLFVGFLIFQIKEYIQWSKDNKTSHIASFFERS